MLCFYQPPSLDKQLDRRLGPRQQRLSMTPQLRLPAAAPRQQQRQLGLEQDNMAAAAAVAAAAAPQGRSAAF
jgi:hypothetical protein